jgi:hypothetical protein
MKKFFYTFYYCSLILLFFNSCLPSEIITETVKEYDTIYIKKIDTVYLNPQIDTIFVNDICDTVFITKFDTIFFDTCCYKCLEEKKQSDSLFINSLVKSEMQKLNSYQNKIIAAKNNDSKKIDSLQNAAILKTNLYFESKKVLFLQWADSVKNSAYYNRKQIDSIYFDKNTLMPVIQYK